MGLTGLAVAEKSRSWLNDATSRTRRCAGAQVSGVRRTHEAGAQRGPEEASRFLVLRQRPVPGREQEWALRGWLTETRDRPYVISRGCGRRTQTTPRPPYRSAQSVAVPPRTCLGRPEFPSSGLLASRAAWKAPQWHQKRVNAAFFLSKQRDSPCNVTVTQRCFCVGQQSGRCVIVRPSFVRLGGRRRYRPGGKEAQHNGWVGRNDDHARGKHL